jgi:hypothetical protein
MNIKARLRISFILLVFIFTATLEAEEIVQQTHDVEVRVLLIDVEKIDTVSQSFTANLSVVMRWQDPSLAHEGPASISVPLDDIWIPRIQILNQQKIV